jgi:hypothetical protein
MAVALAALFVALGGTAFAVSSLPRNSVGTKHLRKHAVTARKIHSGAVTAAKLAATVTRFHDVPVPGHSSGSVTATCAAGERLIGGGAKFVGDPAQDSQLLSSRPGFGADGSGEPPEGTAFTAWRVVANTHEPGGTTLRAYALCLQ